MKQEKKEVIKEISVSISRGMDCRLKLWMTSRKLAMTDRFFIVDQFRSISGVVICFVPRELMCKGGEVAFGGV